MISQTKAPKEFSFFTRMKPSNFNDIVSPQGLVFGVFSVLLYFTTKVNYLLFHSLVELISVSIAFLVFAVTWNSKNYLRYSYLSVLGVSYLFIGLLDLLHTLAYPGMNIFTDYDFYANQLWIATRFLESCSLFVAIFYIKKGIKFGVNRLLITYALISIAIILSIFTFRIFPECFIEGQGQTVFKIYCEYLICLILAGTIGSAIMRRSHLDNMVYKFLVASLVLTMISELAFTFYISNYGISNLVGHYFKLFSFYLLYLIIAQKGISEPYSLVFKQLHSSEQLILKIMNSSRDAILALQPVLGQDQRINNYKLLTSNETYSQLAGHQSLKAGSLLKGHFPFTLDTDLFSNLVEIHRHHQSHSRRFRNQPFF